jgi:hypothetical protein
MAAAIVVAATLLFVAVWIFSPTQGLLRRTFHKHLTSPDTTLAEPRTAS